MINNNDGAKLPHIILFCNEKNIARLANLNDSNLPQGDEALHGGGDVVHGVVGVVEAVTEEDGVEFLKLGPLVTERIARDCAIIGGCQHGADGRFGEHDISLSHTNQLCAYDLLVEGDVVADEIGGLLKILKEQIQHS